jgi:hypothetical protein
MIGERRPLATRPKPVSFQLHMIETGYARRQSLRCESPASAIQSWSDIGIRFDKQVKSQA